MDEIDAVDGAGAEADEPMVRKLQKELNAGSVPIVLLALLAAANEPLYGYAIAKSLEERAHGAPLAKPGTLYPVRRTMEANGLRASEVEPSVAGPPRRYYRITPEGRRTLGLWREAWARTRDFVEGFLEAGDRAAGGANKGARGAS